MDTFSVKFDEVGWGQDLSVPDSEPLAQLSALSGEPDNNGLGVKTTISSDKTVKEDTLKHPDSSEGACLSTGLSNTERHLQILATNRLTPGYI
jgi:hypothetical protein